MPDAPEAPADARGEGGVAMTPVIRRLTGAAVVLVCTGPVGTAPKSAAVLAGSVGADPAATPDAGAIGATGLSRSMAQ